MRNRFFIAFGMILVCTGFASASYSSSSCPIGNEHITMDVKDAAVADIFGFMGELTGLNFVLDECVAGRITLKLENTPVETALAAILNSLAPREVQAILRGLAGIDVVGGDVVEVAPQYDATTNTAQAGAQMLFEIFTLMAFSPSLRKRRTAG